MIIIGKFILGWIFAILSQFQKSWSWFLSHKKKKQWPEWKKKSQPIWSESNASISWIQHLRIQFVQGRCTNRYIPSIALVSQPGTSQSMIWLLCSPECQHSLVLTQIWDAIKLCSRSWMMETTVYTNNLHIVSKPMQLWGGAKIWNICNLHSQNQMLLWSSRCYCCLHYSYA